MTVDAAGNTYLTGSTTSTAFPTTAGALQTQFSGGTCEVLPGLHGVPLMFPCADAFVIKLDPSGNVLFATYFGGNGNETGASAISVDASGNVYLAGLTGPNSVSQPATFPVTPGAAFTNVADGGGFVAKLNSSGTALVYSTLLPVNPPALARQRAVAMAVDPAGQVYIATTTAGALAFPTTPGAFQPAPPPANPNGSGVVAKLNASGSALLYATYLSGNGLSIPQGIAIDAAGDAFVAGFTQAADFPVTPGVFQTGYFPSAEYMEFITKLNSKGTGLVYSTFLGATRNYASEIKVDAQGGAYVAAEDGADLSSGGYLSHLSADGSALLYSTYVPTGTAMDLALDSAGSAFVAGASGMEVLTPSPGAFQSGLVGVTGNVIAAKFTSDGQFAGGTYALRIVNCRRWTTDRGGSQWRDRAGGRAGAADGRQHFPVADGAERGERRSEHRRARRDRHAPRLRAWSRDGRGRGRSGSRVPVGRYPGHLRRYRGSRVFRAVATRHRAGAVGDHRPNVH